MSRPSLEDIFAEDDEFGLLDVKPRAGRGGPAQDRGVAALLEVTVFYERHSRLPDPDAMDHDEMHLGVIWDVVKQAPTDQMRAVDRLGLLGEDAAPTPRAWQDDPVDADIPDSLDDIFADDDLDVDASLVSLKHTTPSAERHVPDHRADFVPCQDFEQFRERFEAVQRGLEVGERKANPVRKWSVIEPIEGDFFIRNGLLAMIAEKSEMTARGGARDHRLRVIFSNGTESDPLMSSFRKSLNEDKTARMVQKVGLGPLDPEWESDQLELSGTIYVARSRSENPEIKGQRMILHKIGVTSQDVARRVADAKNDPTFLLAPVEIVATYSLQNLSRSKVESLLHRFFAAARPAELFVTDRFGKKVFPKEWFYVLPEHVGQAAKLIEDGTLHRYRYDVENQSFVLKIAST
ncbi:MAG: GIY-YIG nuclease family protein [Oceanospirillaceae bacterium]|uniref:GIY-YIG nuclease family protein n=1 Tax=Salipiger sp. HF18 TaxID=2721557 RepID=UPI00142D95BA|nr:GIY-YIG nuclease family protein [Salipiger sp. HF18]NIY95768.1 GIY-YIG nuclease family protein [Salipiger sp. HF18]NVK42384.1 GIY-YIG nuclease family protein [Oceanospirillaceae bacterium]